MNLLDALRRQFFWLAILAVAERCLLVGCGASFDPTGSAATPSSFAPALFGLRSLWTRRLSAGHERGTQSNTLPFASFAKR